MKTKNIQNVDVTSTDVVVKIDGRDKAIMGMSRQRFEKWDRNKLGEIIAVKCKNCGKDIYIKENYIRQNMFCTLGCMNLYKGSTSAAASWGVTRIREADY